MDRSSSPPKKKRKTEEAPQSIAEFSFPPPPVPVRGGAFTSGIKALADGGNNDVYTQLNLPYQESVTKTTGRAPNKVTTTTNEPRTVDSHGTYGVTRQQASLGTKQWTQGLLTPMGDTSYFEDDKRGKAVPSTMTLKTATMESRAMKFLSMDAPDYTPKNDIVATGLKGPTEAPRKGKRGNPDQALPESSHWGGLAMGSFLEEVTGKRALGLGNIGSGMRAMTMASKWRMKSQGTTSEAGFGDKMLAAFPQLGKQSMKPAKLGASVLWDEINAGDGRKDAVLKHHLGFGGSIYKAHVEARAEAKKQFNDKLKQVQTGTDPNALGKWWGGQSTKHGFVDMDKPEKAQDRKELRDEYIGTKLGRHEIKYFASPSRVAKDAFKKQFVETGKIDKAADPAKYKQEKHNWVVARLEEAGFDASRVKANRAIKNTFAGKLDALQKDTAVKGKWWEAKAKSGVDFKTLNNDQRKALKQEYVAHKKSKPPK